ncbi:IclR family transcriptional regulator C-terminal domain-containing protein [Streptomyces sp. AS02]|uniref:IclR family transcriptional regulator domain-containing protein n=1 Tax=Streptomyces sp. AS02 TaxID=2938946 RepID=UPI002020574D|nr:IclR family transcriptional regulator C-terminal domain-containing protein [Streptomyces sp. AS02]MCL8014889.1 helix-turn-helix domain-containing protein [Streptomyces sp. AS02]
MRSVENSMGGPENGSADRTDDGSDGTPAHGPHFVQALARGLDVIRAFDADHSRMTFSEVARRCDVTRSTARRCLLTLADLGYVRTDGKYFELTPHILRLGYAYLSGASLPDLAQPHLRDLVDTAQASASLCVLDGADIVNVARVRGSRVIRDAHGVGNTGPAHATAAGRVLLAWLPDDELARHLPDPLPRLTARTITALPELRAELLGVRAQGFALVDGEFVEGLRSVAAPVRDRTGAVAAAVSVSALTGHRPHTVGDEQIIAAVREAARRIETDIRSGPEWR